MNEKYWTCKCQGLYHDQGTLLCNACGVKRPDHVACPHDNAAVCDCPRSQEEGRKLDQDKLDWTLVPFDALEPIVRVLEFGAKKYARDNWLHVEGSTHRYTKALLRHVLAYARGEEKDPETGESHLAHAICCGLFILSNRRTKP